MMDSGHKIQALTPNVQNQINSARGNLENAAAATGFTELDIIAPVAREMNKTDVNDYSRGFLGPAFRAQQHQMALYSYDQSITGDLIVSPLTEADYQADYNSVVNLNQPATLFGKISLDPVNVDCGPGNIKLKTAMNAGKYPRGADLG